MSSPFDEVVILNDYASLTGGSSAVAIASAIGLAARGLRVTYFACVGPVAPVLRAVPNLEVHCLDQPEIARDPKRGRAFFTGLRNARAVAALRGVLAGKDPSRTLVHVHTWMKALSPYALDEVEAQGFPLVVTLHDFFIACPTGGFYEHHTGRLCQRTPLSGSCLRCNCDRRSYPQKLWRSFRTYLQNERLRVPRRAAHYIGVSNFSVDLLRPYLPDDVPVTVVRNPAECPDEGPVDVRRNEAMVFVGRLVPEKGVRLFAYAARRTGLPAVFIGDGELREELHSLCPEARFTGWLSPEGIRAELRRARALVFPPLWYETLGLVAIEAAAAGVPAIVSDRCAATDYVWHGENGLHFSHGSVEALAIAMRELANDAPRAATLGRAAYDWYWNNPWTVDRHVDELLAVYRSLAADPTPETNEVLA
ncbi:MAG TPA: glycosyltransferase family 4 protein [Candidatus Didemnitutus sp.]|nr:glycosyltransferase family 4 protein [Candidatus Didemnitutus sp.]